MLRRLVALRRLFTAGNGRVISRWITLNQTMGNHLPDRARLPGAEIDSYRVRNNGLNGTSPPGRPAVEDQIYYCAGSCKSAVLEHTIDRQQGQSNPNTTIKHIKLTTMHITIKGLLLDSFDCYS
jgi:hypothetical protein